MKNIYRRKLAKFKQTICFSLQVLLDVFFHNFLVQINGLINHDRKKMFHNRLCFNIKLIFKCSLSH